LLGVDQIDLGELLDATLDRVGGGEHPLRRVCTTRRVIGQQAGKRSEMCRTMAPDSNRTRFLSSIAGIWPKG
jgi:hypothetical protein